MTARAAVGLLMATIAITIFVFATGGATATRLPTGPRATFRALVGTWIGHTRQLYIHSDGTAREIVNDGCCHTVYELNLQLLTVRGVPRSAVAESKVVRVSHLDKATLAGNHIAPPRVGELDSLRLRHRIVTDGLMRVTFCPSKPPYLPGSPCGA